MQTRSFLSHSRPRHKALVIRVCPLPTHRPSQHMGRVCDRTTHWVNPGSWGWHLLGLLFEMSISQTYEERYLFCLSDHIPNIPFSDGPAFFALNWFLCFFSYRSIISNSITARVRLLHVSPLIYKLPELRDWLLVAAVSPACRSVTSWPAGNQVWPATASVGPGILLSPEILNSLQSNVSLGSVTDTIKESKVNFEKTKQNKSRDSMSMVITVHLGST